MCKYFRIIGGGRLDAGERLSGLLGQTRLSCKLGLLDDAVQLPGGVGRRQTAGGLGAYQVVKGRNKRLVRRRGEKGCGLTERASRRWRKAWLGRRVHQFLVRGIKMKLRACPIGLVADHVEHEGQRAQAVAEPQHIGPALCIINGTRLLRCFHQLLHLPGHCRDGGASLFTVEHHQNTGNCFKFGDGRAGLLRFLRMAEKIVQRPFHFAHGAA